MAGVKGRSGGARPGSGQKKQDVKIAQETRREMMQKLVTDTDWQDIVLKAVEQAKSGDYVARGWLTPYIAGAAPKELTVKGDIDDPLQIIIRQPLDSE